MKKGGAYLIESAKEDAIRMREYREALREEYEDEYDFEAYEDEEEYEEDIAPKKQRVNKNRQTARRQTEHQEKQ